MIPLGQQLACVQLQIMGEQARIEALVGNPRWPQADLELKRLRVRELEAVAVTLRWLHDNQSMIKQRIAA